ncbi:flagella biosynthesis regulator [Citrobacter amalonaticus]|nr:flagella biosynthesis regulator [Citrobacter amalonaticus]
MKGNLRFPRRANNRSPRNSGPVLERLITRLISLTQQQSAEVWAGMKHDLGVKSDTPLLSRHFPAAEQNLNQRLGVAQQNHANRQVLSQLTELLTQGNNRQAVSDFIRQQYGQTALSQLKPEQLKNVLTLLQQGQLSIPQPQQRPATDRPLLPAEHNTLNQLVTKLAAATGESSKLIWQSMLELSGVKSGELIPAKQFTHLATWLQARQTLSLQHAPTLQSLQAALKQPLEADELLNLKDYAQQTWQIQPQTVLTTAQVQDLLNQIFLRRVERDRELNDPRHIQPIYSPFTPVIDTLRSFTARPGLLFIALLVALLIFWLVI